jgi:hypothetical protein
MAILSPDLSQRYFRPDSWGVFLRKNGEPQVLVHGLAGDAAIAGKDGFRNALAGWLDQLGRPFRVRVFFRPL